MFLENKNKIEDIKKNLYDPNDKIMGRQREGIFHSIKHKTSDEWNDGVGHQKAVIDHEFKKPPISGFKKFFIASVIFFIGALGFAYYKFTKTDISVSNDKIDVTVIGNSFAKGGEELPVQIEITNNNGAGLELADLVVEYPKGADDNSADVVRLPRDTIGTIKPGESVIRNVKVILFGEEKAIRNIKISLVYHPEGSNATFSKDIFYPVTISLAPLSLTVDAPSTTNSNQPITFNLTATLNTSLSGGSPVLQVTYPNNFVFISAIPAPILGNSTWDISSIAVGSPINVQIKGKLIGQEGDEQTFHAYVGDTNGTDRSTLSVIYSSILQKVSIVKPFLDVRVLVNKQDSPSYVTRGGSEINAEVDWTNNLPTRITDAQIIINLSGNVFDEKSVNPDAGFYDSVNNQIIWDRNSLPQLAEVNPGEKGEATFSFKTYPMVGLSSLPQSPQVSMKVSIKGREPLLGSTYNDINNFSEKIIKVSSDFQIASSAFYLSGNLPPKAESETNYIVTWTLSNSVNAINQAQARAILPIYVDWKGVASGQNDNLIYNDVTREVIWNIGSVLPGTGINSNREISFMISLNPSMSQVGSVPQLMQTVYLSGTDTFTNTGIKSSFGSISTRLTSDPNFNQNNARVGQ